MTGTIKTSRIATLEDVTRRFSVGIAARATMLEEGISLARQARAQLADAEASFVSALGALSALKPALAGSSEYTLTCSRLIGEVAEGVEADLQDLRGAQSSVAQLEEPTADVLQRLLAYSLEAIQARIRGRMHKLGGDFTGPALPRAATPSWSQSAGPQTRRRESIPPREIVWSEIDDSMAMDVIVQAGLENFERGAALLEGSFEALQTSQTPLANAQRTLEALARKFRGLEEREQGSSASEIHGIMSQLESLAVEAEQQAARLARLATTSERVRAPLLAVFENMGRLLMSSVVTESNANDAREASAKQVLARALGGEPDAIREFALNADNEQLQAMSDALYHVARTQEGAGLPAVESLRALALSGSGSRTIAGDNLLSLSNSSTAPEAVRAAATAALMDLADSSGTEG